VAWLGLVLGLTGVLVAQAPLTTLEYLVTGQELRVSPVAVSVPKGIAGSINAELVGVGPADSIRVNTLIEATLRGPTGPAQRVLGAVGQPLLLPPLSVVGDYQLDGIRLARVEGTNLVTVLEGNPSSVPVRVFDEVLVSRVTSRPLTSAEIDEKGIFIDESNFRAVEFEVGFVLDGKTIPVRFPVVTPRFRETAEIIPAAELLERAVLAEQINQELMGRAVLPPELETARLNIQVQPVNFQLVDSDGGGVGLQIPPIPALMVIPGNIGFLNQFFSVQLFTENAAPGDSGLSVINVKGELVLPPGDDQVPATTFEQPGDDPLRFARIGSAKEIQRVRSVTRAGPDGTFGTADDIARLKPGEAGQAEFLVEGLREGLHLMEITLTADLEGLAAGVVKITGKAAGSVLVRNPNFSLAFSHPRTVRAGEPYDASVTVLNTSLVPANRVRVTLPKSSLSGAVFEGNQQATVELGDIAPGQTATARYRLRAQQTGSIKFSNLTTSDDASKGSFLLTMGVDERGVALSPDTLLLPDLVTNLPSGLRIAADRVLGQAISIATAGKVPAGVQVVPKSMVIRRAVELAEAGQRLLYDDSRAGVLVDLLLDWQGGREFQGGWDQLMRETEAGREWRAALMAELETVAPGRVASLIGDLGAAVAGRGERWLLAGFEEAAGEVRLELDGRVVDSARSAVPGALGYPGPSGGLLVVRDPGTNGRVRWQLAGAGPEHLNVVRVGNSGEGERLDWTTALGDGCFLWDVREPSPALRIDPGCTGEAGDEVSGNTTPFREVAPVLLSVQQDLSVLVARPEKPCPIPQIRNYANILAVLFSKPMDSTTVSEAAAYTLGNGNGAAFVQIQPGGRVALITLKQPVGGLVERKLNVATSVTDVRGNSLAGGIQTVISDYRDGVQVRGRVVRGGGGGVAGVPVTLTFNDQYLTAFDCAPWVRRVAQVTTDASGNFAFDFILSGIPYVISTTDTSGLSAEEIRLILESTVAGEFRGDRYLSLLKDGSLFDSPSEMRGSVVAAAEGVDRAVFNDAVDLNSVRSGTAIPVVLTFRGRATLLGRVLAADGVTPVAEAAVNLFPDPDSRELVRGMLTDAEGRFAFFGVPLGVFSLDVQDGRGLDRILSEALNVPGEVRELDVVLSSTVVERGTLRGRVLEPDNLTPHGGGRVLVLQGEGALRAVTADDAGQWQVNDLPAGLYNLAAISRDGRRKGRRSGLVVPGGGTNFADISLNGTAVVRGRVLTSSGERGVANALVAGGDVLVRTDASGFFTVAGVPIGRSTLNAGVERSEDGQVPKSNPAFDFPRFGSASLEVLPGEDNFVAIQLAPAARITGRVFNADGTPKGGAMICHPTDEGFEFIFADPSGRFSWEAIPVGKAFQISVPSDSPPINDVSVPTADDVRADPAAALAKALEAFMGINDPFLNGKGANFSAVSHDERSVVLNFDGDTRDLIFRIRPTGRVAGRVLNGQGVPIGATVRVTGEGLSAKMNPTVVIRGDTTSDAQTGEFSVEGVAVGNIQVQAASPFFPSVITATARTTSTERDATNIVLQFPAAQETQGRLAGRVFEPDGRTLVGAGVKVGISFGTLVIETEANGRFDTRFGLPAPASYTVIASNQVSGLVGRATVTVQPTGTNTAGSTVDVRLLGRGGLRIRVVQFDGTPASGARVQAQGGDFPGDRAEGTTAADGTLVFGNLFEGGYAISADFLNGATRIFGRAGVGVPRDGSAEVTVRLQPTASLTGRYVLRDGVTPVAFAQVAIGALGFATTDATGRFGFEGVPLGTHRLVSNDPVTGRAATLDVSFAVAGQVRDVVLVEQSLGTVTGVVINSTRTGPLANAEVQLTAAGISGSRTVTTGPDGRFSFANVPAGRFTLSARDEVLGMAGTVSAVLPEDAASLTQDIEIEALASLVIQVWRGSTNVPGTNVTVGIGPNGANFLADTDERGRASFANLRLGTYVVQAVSKAPEDNHNGVILQRALNLGAAGPAPDFEVVLPGVGQVTGQVLGSDGTTPAESAVVTLRMLGAQFLGIQNVAVTAANGRFAFSNIAVGPYVVTAQKASLSAAADGTIAAGNEVDEVALTLFPSGTVTGRLVRENGTTPVGEVEVGLAFRRLGSSQGRTSVETDAAGVFRFTGVPLGDVRFTANVDRFGGVATRTGALSTDGQTLDLGVVRLDESVPALVSMDPLGGSEGVPVTQAITLLFSEALDPASIDRGGIFLRTLAGTEVPVRLSLEDAGDGLLRRVRMVPSSRLQSLVTYQVVVLENERPAVLDIPERAGPTDLEGRFLAVPFVAVFTTADNDPPVLLSVFPADNQEEIDPRAVLRLSFNEPIEPEGNTFVLTGPAGPVPGVANVGVGGLVLAFTPTAFLQANATYTWSVSGVRDLAGNAALNQPITGRFQTIDDRGPALSTLRIAEGVSPVAGRTVTLEGLLVQNEAGARVRFSDEGTTIATATTSPFRVSVTLPDSGKRVYRAVGIDRFGNESEPLVLEVTVLENEPPVVSLVRVTPATGPVPGGSTLRLNVSATDDVQVTNVTVVASGFVKFTNSFPNGGLRTIAVPVPVEVPEGAVITFTATARDFRGQESVAVVVEVPLLSRPLPTLAVDLEEGVLELVERRGTNVVVAAGHVDGGLARLDLIGTGFTVLSWTNNGATNLVFSPALTGTNAVLQVVAAAAGTNDFTIRATATNGLETSRVVRVIALPDLDLDGIADRDDPDVDGDGLDLEAETLLGTDPEKADTDADGLSDPAEVALGTDPRRADTDGDGIRDSADRFPLAPNLTPVAVDDSFPVRFETPIELRNSTIVGNDVDPEGEFLQFVSYFPPVNGRLSPEFNGVITYTPAAGFTGEEILSYIVRDPHGLQATGRVHLVVLTNRPPVAGEGLVDFTVPSGGLVLLNLPASDPNGDRVGLRITQLPSHGRLIQVEQFQQPNRVVRRVAGLTLDGLEDVVLLSPITSVPTEVIDSRSRVVYSPDPGYTGPDSFRYLAFDSEFESASVEVRGVVTPNAAADTDGDGMLDAYELANGLDARAADADLDKDADGLTNAAEFAAGTRADLPDTDGDGQNDAEDPRPLVANRRPVADVQSTLAADAPLVLDLVGSDPDGDVLTTRITAIPFQGRLFRTLDGVTRGEAVTNVPVDIAANPVRLIYVPLGNSATNELRYTVRDGSLESAPGVFLLVSTNRPNADADGDGLPDGYELAEGLDPFADDVTLDRDGDGLANLDEFNRGLRAGVADTDGDQLRDGAEIAAGTNPLNPDTDGDGIIDGVDPNPLVSDLDQDGDGIADADDLDIDGDGLMNDQEVVRDTDPRNPDTDGDRWQDGLEVALESDPRLAASTPTILVVGQPVVDVVLPAGPSVDVTLGGIVLAEPAVDVVLPTAPSTDVTAGGIVVSEPAVDVVLPTAPSTDVSVGGIVVSEPAVDVVLPAAPSTDVTVGGIVVSEPTVDIVLPAAPSTDVTVGGIVVSEPAVDVVLPAQPADTAGLFGMVVSEPVVFVDWEPDPGSGPGGSGTSGGTGSGTGDGAEGVAGEIRLLSLRVDPAVGPRPADLGESAAGEAVESWWVTLEWRGPAGARYRVESSEDLQTWRAETLDRVVEGGVRCTGRCRAVGDVARFYRVRWTE
jgi:hypothetical protein